MKFVLSPHRSRLTADNSEGCVELKVTNYESNIKALSEEKQEQGSHSTRMLLCILLCLNNKSNFNNLS